ncbi:MAG TPA: hypothetical protein VLI44_10435, partial [Sporolactobacillaceae bacterium]|nr:hypothetical protein [Sporolactobacillaceae bacterium]
MAVLALFLGFGVIIQAKPPAISRAKSASSRVSVARPLSEASSFPGMFTFRNDGFRTGQNLFETILTPSTVKPGAFGRLFIDSVDGMVYAQPLYVPAVTMPDDVHNVVYVA